MRSTSSSFQVTSCQGVKNTNNKLSLSTQKPHHNLISRCTISKYTMLCTKRPKLNQYQII